MSIDGSQPTERKFDLEERTARFGESVIAFSKRIPINAVTQPLISQLVRAATTTGSNYCEADDAGTRKEFLYRVSVCKRESRETKYWLRMVATAVGDLKPDARTHWLEAKELHLIFAAIYRNSRKNT